MLKTFIPLIFAIFVCITGYCESQNPDSNVLPPISSVIPQRNSVTGDDGYPIRIGHGSEIAEDKRIGVIASLIGEDANAIKNKLKETPLKDYSYSLLPSKNYVQILDNMGKPIPDVILRFYQSYYGAVPNEIIFAGRTDSDGKYLLPNRHITDKDNKTVPNPFGKILPKGANAYLFFSITARGYTEYRFLDALALNIAYMMGKKDSAVYQYKTAIGAEGAPKPPILEGDFLSTKEILLRWYKYPNYWAESFNMYLRKTGKDSYDMLPHSFDESPFEVFMQTNQSKGIWEKNFQLEDYYYEFYLTSVGDFERESSPSKILTVPSERYRGNPSSVTVDDAGNIIYATINEKSKYRIMRIDERKRFSSSFLESGSLLPDTLDIIFTSNMIIVTSHTQAILEDPTGKGMAQIFFYDKYGTLLFAENNSGLYKPSALNVQGDKVYICDEGNNIIFTLSLSDGSLSKFGEASLASKKIKSPSGIAASLDGIVAISDMGNNRILLLNDKGEFIKELSGMKEPRGIFYYGNKFYIADTGNNRIVKTDKNLNIVGTIEKNLEEPFNRPMDVWVHHYPAQDVRKAFAILYIADYGSHQIREEAIPEEELETHPPIKSAEIKQVVAYGTAFDHDDPDTTLKPLQIVLSGLLEPEFFTKEFIMKLDNVPEGLIIKKTEVPFIVDEYFQAFVDFQISFSERSKYEPKPDGENYALESKGATTLLDENEMAGYLDDMKGTVFIPVEWKCLKPKAVKTKLSKEVVLNRIDVLFHENDDCYYDFSVEISSDAKTWTPLSPTTIPNVIRNMKAIIKKFNPKDTNDDAAHIALEYERGYRGWVSFPVKDAGKVKYIRVTPRYSNQAPSADFVKVQAWGTAGQ
jgi:hypothetical protein